MDLTPTQFDDLVGAYVLDACDPDEAGAVERYVSAHPDAAAEVERLSDVAAGLAAIGPVRPPVDLLDRLLQAVTDRVPAARPAEALARETERFDLLVRSLRPEDLERTTHNGLSVRELVAHVEAIDRAFVEAAADPRARLIAAPEVEAITAAELARFADEPFDQTCARFRRTRRALIGLAGAVPDGQRIAGYGRDETLVVRAFETWTHHDDICRALGRSDTVPDAPVVRAMAELSVQSLPLALAVRGITHPGRAARIVLSGPGGGDWIVPGAPGEQPSGVDVVLRAPVVEWCRRFADRLDAVDVPVNVDGDVELAADLLAAAPAFAGL